MKNNNTDQQSNQKNPSLLDSTKPFAKPIAKLGVGAGGATAAALLIAGPIGIIIAVLIAAFAAYSAGKDVKEIYDSENAKNSLNSLNGEQIGQAAKNLINSSEISPAIERYNKKSNAEKQINDTTIDNFGNNTTLQENFQKIINHYQNNLPSAVSLGSTLKNIYNKNCKDGKSFGLTDVAKLQSTEGLAGLFDDLKPDSQDKFVELVALIANNPKIIDKFAEKPSQINDLMKECEKGNGDIDVIKEKINAFAKATEGDGPKKDSSQPQHDNKLDIKSLLNQTELNQTQDNKTLPDNTPQNVNGGLKR